MKPPKTEASSSGLTQASNVSDLGANAPASASGMTTVVFDENRNAAGSGSAYASGPSCTRSLKENGTCSTRAVKLCIPWCVSAIVASNE